MSSTVIQAAVCKPARDTSRFSARNPSCPAIICPCYTGPEYLLEIKGFPDRHSWRERYDKAGKAKPGGRIVVADTCASADPVKAAAFNLLEKLRDPSHVRALPLAELEALYDEAGLPRPDERFTELRDTVDNLLARSFPNPGDEEKIRDLFAASILDDRLGIPLARDGGMLSYAYPVAILTAPRN